MRICYRRPNSLPHYP